MLPIFRRTRLSATIVVATRRPARLVRRSWCWTHIRWALTAGAAVLLGASGPAPAGAPVARPATVRPSAVTQWCLTPSGEQEIDPCDATAQTNAGQQDSLTFTVTNTGPDDVGYITTVDCPQLGTTCSVSPSAPHVGSGGGTNTVTAYWTVPPDTAGSVWVTVHLLPPRFGGGSADTLHATVHVTAVIPPTYTVSVTPDGTSTPFDQPVNTSTQFTVANVGNTTATYTLAATCSGGTTGCSAPASVAVASGSSEQVTVDFNSGTPGSAGTVTLTASHTGTSDQGFITVQPLTHTVVVHPESGADTVPAATTTTAPFTVELTGTASSVNYNLEITSCQEPVYDCTVPSTATATQIMPASVNVSYHTRADLHGGTGGIALRAYSTYGPTTYDAIGSYTVTVLNTASPILMAVTTPTTSIARDRCLTVAAGRGGAYECGDLRLIHALPSVRTMAKARTPVLLYASQTAALTPRLSVNVSFPGTASTPTALAGALTIDGQSCGAQSWGTSGWTPGTTRRIVAACGNLTVATGLYPYTLALTATFPGGGTLEESTSGSLIVVNRSTSPFGAGWWLAGVETLHFPTDADLRLWVGGDGSARVYRRRGTSNAFYADSVDRPDSLTYDPGTATYTRWAPHRLQVRFNSAGQHIATVNRLGQTTTFSYASGRLSTITVAPTTAGLTYTLSYTSGVLSSVTAPGVGGSRVTTLARSAGRITGITDPDTTTVTFGYAGTGTLVTTRTDRLGHTTTYSYGALGTLSGVSLAMASPTPAIATSFAPAEIMGRSGTTAADTSDVATVVNGPRHDTTVTTIWLDRFGQPRRIEDAVGGVTTITRGDGRWPALATQLTRPGGFTTTATYDGRGNLSTETALDPLDGAGDAVTRYQYDGAFDVVTRITGPTGEVWRATVDPTTGNRTAEQLTDTGSVHNTAYRYDATCGLVRAVIAAATPPDSIVYDGRCNPAAVRSPKGAWTFSQTDTLGRVVADSGPTGLKDSTVYDVMGRVVTARTTGPDVNGSGVQTRTVANSYDDAGQLTAVSRTGAPDPTGVGTVTTHYRYDWAGRRVATVAADGAVDSTGYDASGNAVTQITRLGGAAHPITMRYDALNRLRHRVVPAYAYPAEAIGLASNGYTAWWRHAYPLHPNVTGQAGYTVPAQVDTFSYDGAGRLVLANNGDARVSRTYYPNGLLASETARLRTRADTTAGGDFTSHVYTTSSAYDLAGRRTTLTVPQQLAPRIQPDTLSAALLLAGTTREITDQITYTYDTGADGTGWLTRIDGLLPSDVVRYGYTPRGEVALRHLVMDAPDGPPARSLVESRTYDADGGLQTLQVLSDDGGADTLRDAHFTHDAAGRVLTASDGASDGLGITPTTATYHYSGLGALRLSDVETVSPFGTTQLGSSEAMTYDALGNWQTRETAASEAQSVPGGGGFGLSTAASTAAYATGTGRLVAQDLGDSRADTLIYDAAGNLHAMLTTHEGNPGAWSERVSYYGVDGRLVAADARQVAFGGTTHTGHAAFETYRYDALGRRVWAWAQRYCDDEQGFGGGADAVPCQSSTVRRTVWDGSQELAEIQMPADSTTSVSWVENDTLPVERPVPGTGTPGYDANRRYGRVLYVQGLATDQPVAITRVNYADATDAAVGSVPWAVYAPFSVLPLWDATGRADRGVVGGTAAPGQDLLCTDAGQTRCAVVAYDQGRFPYARAGADPGSWQGTLVVDKADATGTYYRRNRSYDPQTARWTQEDPIGLAGGLNLYGYANGDPINYSDPFGLCVPMPWCLLAAGGAGGGIITLGDITAVGSAAAELAPPVVTAEAGAGLGYLLLRPAFPGDGTLLTRTLPGAVQADATVVYSKDKADEGGHRNNPRESTRERHERGDERRRRDQGREKGDSRRKPNPNKRRPPRDDMRP